MKFTIHNTVNLILKHKANYYREITKIGFSLDNIINNPDQAENEISKLKNNLINLTIHHQTIKEATRELINLIEKGE